MLAWLAEIAMMLAPGFRKYWYDARQVLNVPSRSISMTALNALADMPSTGAGKLPAAPATRMSISPNWSRVLWSAASTAGYSRTSRAAVLAVPPDFEIAAAAA